MGWLEVEDFWYPGGWVSVAAVRLPSFGAVHRGGQPSCDERKPAYPLQRQTGPEFESQPDPVLIIVMYYIKCRKPNKILIKK